MATIPEYEERVVTDSSDKQSTRDYYSSWSIKYEADMVTSNYNGPRHVVEAFLRLGLDKDVKILDLLAGTGLVAEMLKGSGYVNIEAIDGCRDMLELANTKKLYRDFHIALLGGGNSAPIPSETYDVIISSGSFAPGHLYLDAIPDLIRLLKKGGLMVWSMRQGYENTSPGFSKFYEYIDELVEQKMWTHHVSRVEVDEYLLGSKGYVYIMRKL